MQQSISGVINNMDNMEHLSLSTNNHKMAIFTENQRPTPNIFKCWGPQVPIFRRFNNFNASFPKIFQYDSSDSYSTHSTHSKVSWRNCWNFWNPPGRPPSHSKPLSLFGLWGTSCHWEAEVAACKAKFIPKRSSLLRCPSSWEETMVTISPLKVTRIWAPACEPIFFGVW